ncbi:MAG TPA: PhnD/SsuA/transferrin family substrate-binding protein [Sulfuricaulis sp.]
MEGERTCQPIAEYLSRVTGKNIVYRHPKSWLTYQTEMQSGNYDLVFDGPHLNSWHISHLRHSALVKVAGEHAFAVVVRKDNSGVTELKQLAGQKVCGIKPPNLGTLSVLAQFDNPMRQPLIINNIGWTSAYEGVAFEKKCAAAIVPVANLKTFPNHETIVRVLYNSKVLPNQAFSARPRMPVCRTRHASPGHWFPRKAMPPSSGCCRPVTPSKDWPMPVKRNTPGSMCT